MSSTESKIVAEGKWVGHAASERSWGLSETTEGKPTLGVRFAITSGPSEGQTLVAWFNFTDKAWKRSAQSLALVGWDGGDVRNLKLDPTKEVELEVVHETFKGEMRAKIAWVNALGVHTDRPLPDGVAADFAGWLSDSWRDARYPPP